MMNKKLIRKNLCFGLFVLIVFANQSVAQDMYRESILEYIETYAPIAIREMNRTGFPASIKIAQGIHESGAGKSMLVKKSNNHFGLKCKSNWTGGKVYHDDDERGECFRQYEQAEESYEDHSNYLKSQERYASLFELDPNDYESWAWGLKKAGYATSPVYAQTLIKYIETYQLNVLNDYAAEEEQDEPDLSTYFTALNESKQVNPAGKKPTVSGPAIDEERSETVGSAKNAANASSTSKNTVNSNKATTKSKANYGSIFKINGLKVIEAEKGTSLLSIAKDKRIQLSALLAFNDLASSTTTLKQDQLIFLQAKKKTGKKEFHKVRKGESLYEISQLEGIKFSSLLKLNKLKKGMEPKIGQQLSLKSTTTKRPLLAKR
jgi:LysM repeat protein